MATTRTRSPRRGADNYDDEYDDLPRRSGRGPSGPMARRFGLPVVAAALIGGLFVGYIVSSGGSGTATVTETKTVSAPSSAAAPGGATASGAASRATIALTVLNGSGESGLAGRTADTAKNLGYTTVTAADAPSPTTSSEVVYREGFAAQAQQVADDLDLPTPTPAQVGSGLLAVSGDAQVIVVLGSAAATTGSGAATDSGTATDPAAGTGTAPTDAGTPTQ